MERSFEALALAVPASAASAAVGPAGGRAPTADVDATLVTAHSDKEGAAPTFKRGFGHHPLWALVDHGPGGTGEPLAVLLRPGNAGSNTAAGHAPWAALLHHAITTLRTLPAPG